MKMNEQRNDRFISKFLEARQLDKEAFQMLLPDSVKPHVQAIEKEVKEMILECLCGKETHQKKSEGTVKKVDIE